MTTSSNILLESGTNEVEMLEFLLDNQSFGVNVSKVTSIVRFEKHLLTNMPDTPPELMGAFMFRGETIPLINLSQALHRKDTSTNERPLVIATEFNDFQCGLYVTGVERIHRLSWKSFVPIDNSFSKATDQGSILGTIHINEKDVLIIDIESISTRLFEGLSMEENAHRGLHEIGTNAKRNDMMILLAEDSGFIRNHISKVLKDAGYTNIIGFENGAAADTHIRELIAENRHPNVLISDIEMPMMDGLSLCKKVKQEYNLNIPVIMFSSLINEQMRHKCDSVGADASITKPQITGLVDMLDSFCGITQEK